MTCPGCRKEMMADRLFCLWCEAFMPNPEVGSKADLFRRLGATLLDHLIFFLGFIFLFFFFAALFGLAGGVAAFLLALFLGWAVFLVAFLKMLSLGLTPGKYLLGERVVDQRTGGNPGLGRMLLREFVGKWVSGLIFGLGYLWAIWDKDNQTWHDKIATTVVIRRPATGVGRTR